MSEGSGAQGLSVESRLKRGAAAPSTNPVTKPAMAVRKVKTVGNVSVAKSSKVEDAPTSYINPGEVDGEFQSPDQLVEDSWIDMVNEIAEMMLAFVYQGFDPIRFRFVLMNILNENNLSVADGRKYIKMAMALFFNRGNKLKDLSKMSEDGRTKLQLLKDNLRLVVEKDAPLTATTVTPARIISCFPDLASYVLQKLPNPRIVGERPVGLAEGLCHPAAASLLPQTSHAFLSDLWGSWRDSFTRVIHNKLDETTQVKMVESAEKYSDIAKSSPLLSEEKRLIALMNVYTEFITKVTDSKSPGANLEILTCFSVFRYEPFQNAYAESVKGKVSKASGELIALVRTKGIEFHGRAELTDNFFTLLSRLGVESFKNPHQLTA